MDASTEPDAKSGLTNALLPLSLRGNLESHHVAEYTSMPPSNAEAVQIRPAAVAGRFYSDDRDRLMTTVNEYLAEGADRIGPLNQVTPTRLVKALICPHAGYIFSGSIAGSAYAALAGHGASIRRVVIIGPAHHEAVHGLAASSADIFDTPLGQVAVDSSVGALSDADLVHFADTAHEDEHAIEVHLPFLLQTLDGPFSIVPLLFGQCRVEQVELVLRHFWHDAETLFIISSDLSHFHSHAEARRLDRQASVAIETLDAEGLTEGSACGRVAIQALLQMARRHHLTATAIDVRTSADTAGSPDSVVGYGAYVFHEESAQ